MATRLLNVLQFIDVAAGATVSLPHGLNEQGTPIVPDRLETNSPGSWVITADEINVTVKNEGGGTESCDVWAERLHSTYRQLGGDPGPAALPIQPWVMASRGGASPSFFGLSRLTYRPEAPDADDPGPGVYTDWAELYAKFLDLRIYGNVLIEMDNRHSTVLDPEGEKACQIPEGVWDMDQAIITDAVGTGGRVSIVWEDNGFVDDVHAWVSRQGLVLAHDGSVHSPVRTTTGAPIHFNGSFIRCYNTDPAAMPLFTTTGGALELEMNASPLFFGNGPGNENNFVSPAPLADAGAEDLVFICNAGPFIAGNVAVTTGLGILVSTTPPQGGTGWASDQPGLAGFNLSVNNNKGAGVMPIVAWDDAAKGSSFAPQTPHAADYDAVYNEIVPVDTNGVPAFTVTLPSASVAQEYVAVKDVGGNCGETPVTIAAAAGEDIDGLASIPLAKSGGGFVFRSGGGGTWIPVGSIDGDGQALSISPVISGADTAHYNRVHQVDSSGAGFALTLPPAATVPGAEIGVSDVGGGGNTTTTPASGGDTVQNPDVAGGGTPKRWKSDGVSTWVQIA